MATGQDVYCTLVMSDNYLPGAAVLAHSLRDAGTTKKLAAMVTLESLRADTLAELRTLYDYVLPVDRVVNQSPANLYLLNRGDLLYAFTKINLWRLSQFRRIVYLDADIVALRAPDELFDLSLPFAAAPDIGWPDAFNTGLMVLSPNMGDYWALSTLASSGDSFDGADQGLLNQFYEHKDWHRLSFTYNCTPSASYQYEPAYRYYKSKISTVHFIGSEKPWSQSRSASTQSGGIYKELLNRWWAVYDRHYKSSTNGSRVVQARVKGESEAAAITTEPAFTDAADHAEQVLSGSKQPTSTAEQRRFSAPSVEWDATRAPPPAESRPEAGNFALQTYQFNQDPHLFKAPQSYPEPPRDMWYQVPQDKPAAPSQRPKPIFPWEDRQPAKPSRVFADDIQSPKAEAPPALDTSSRSTPANAQTSPTTPTIRVTHEEPGKNYSGVTKNAWDEVAGIDSYVRQMSHVQKLRGQLQVLSDHGKQAQSPETESGPSRERRESIILTDFPSAIERPSLPVTPAPLRRPSFWGEERDEAGQLPQAEGVPDQANWDPARQLEQLRRHSLQMDPNSMSLPAKNVPKRDMPRSSVSAIQEDPESAAHHVHFQGAGTRREPETAAGESSSAKPTFSTVDFAADAPAVSSEEVFSPTEHGTTELR